MAINSTDDIVYESDSLLDLATMIVVCICILPTLLGSLLILACVVKFPSLRTKIHIVIANLAIADLLLGLSYCLAPVRSVLGSHGNQNMVTSKYVNLTSIILYTLSGCSSATSFCLISGERLLSVKCPLRHRVYCTKRRLYGVMAAAWVVNVVISLFPVTDWYSVVEHKIGTQQCRPGRDHLPLYETLIVLYILTGMLLSTTMYACAVYEAYQHRQRRRQASSLAATQSLQSLVIKKKTKLTILLFSLFVICWFPYLISYLLALLVDSTALRCARNYALILVCVNSAINWAVYGFMNTKFRTAFTMLLHCRSGNASQSTCRPWCQK